MKTLALVPPSAVGGLVVACGGGSESITSRGRIRAAADEFGQPARSILVEAYDPEEGAMATGSSRKIFVNLAVKDLGESVDFFTELGFSFDPRFTDEQATCMIVSDEAFVMLLVEDRFKDFTNKELANPATHTEAIVALSAESREQVDELVDKALQAGGAPANDPMEMDFMYGRSFQDPDGHLWEVVWMDPSALPEEALATESRSTSG